MNAVEKLHSISKKNNSLVCVGLDIDPAKLPEHLLSEKNPYLQFNKEIIQATQDLVCAYKPNMAFYESLGREGMILLEETIKLIPDDILIILDGKRNDIGNTANHYAKSLFETLNTDAITINPYLGADSIKPFSNYTDKLSFILCRTSNPSAIDIQDYGPKDKPLYLHVAEKINEWNVHQNLGAVVGATYPEELKEIRHILGEKTPLLIPGIGKQGGDLESTIKHGVNSKSEMAVINSSRGIIYASNKEDYAQAAREATQQLKEAINSYRPKNL